MKHIAGKFMLIPFIIAVLLLNACGVPGASGNNTAASPDAPARSGADTSAGQSANSPGEQPENNAEPLVLRLAGGDYGYPSPYLHYSRGPGIYKMKLVFDSLLMHGEDGIIPWLAESYEVSQDGLEYTFKIRENVKWHDGSDLTMDDILFSFEYQMKHKPISNALGNNSELISDLRADGWNFIVTVTQENAIMLENIGDVCIIPKHIWEGVETPQEFDDSSCGIGCGPYMITDYDREQGTYKFEAFRDYWGQNQAVDTILFVPVSDGILAFDNDEIDITGITPDILSRYEQSDEYAIITNPGFWGYKLAFNLETAPELQDVNVRRAIAHAVNRADLIEKVARGAAVMPSDGYIPTQSVWYNPQVKNYAYDIDAAKQLLNGRTFDFVLTVASSNAEVRMAELMKLSFAEIGINITVESVDSRTRDSMYNNGEYQLIINGYGGWGGDPELLKSQYADGSIPGYNNAQINELCQQQIVETNPDKRRLLVNELQSLIAEEIPQLPLYNTAGMSVYKPAKYSGWTFAFDHHETTHPKISYLFRD